MTRDYADTEQQQKPNIIFILADDLGISDVNSFDELGRTYYETPNIDKLAREGMKFIQAYTNATNCAPTRAAMLSGQYYPNQPIYHVGRPGSGLVESGEMISAENADELPLEKITDAEMLKRAGYKTALIGKWHIGVPPEYDLSNKGMMSILAEQVREIQQHGREVIFNPTIILRLVMLTKVNI